MITLGIDPSATLAASTWVLAQDGKPVASGKCDDLWENLTDSPVGQVWFMGGLCACELDYIVIESIQAAALASRTGKAADRGHNTLTGVIYTEGWLAGTLKALYPSLPVLLMPRMRILPAIGLKWNTRMEKLDHALIRFYASKGLLTYTERWVNPGTKSAYSRITVSGNPHLAQVDQRDAFAASLTPISAPGAHFV